MRKLLLIFVLLTALFVAVGLLLPRQVHVERSVAVNRPAATVFTLLNSFRRFTEWSPWARLDPHASFAASGPEAGVGARLSWRGDPALVGNGWQQIIASEPYRRIVMDLDYGAQGKARAYFDIRGDRVGCRVTWGFDTDVTAGAGPLGGLLGRYFGLFSDRWIGRDYERGLAAFKTLAESLPPQDFSDLDAEVVEVTPVEVLLASAGSARNPDAIAESLAGAYDEIMRFVKAHGLEVTGQPMAISRSGTPSGYEIEAAIPVQPDDVQPEGRLHYGQSPAGRALRAVHVGPYDTTNATYSKAEAYLAAHGLESTGLSWEHYVSDPSRTPPEQVVTHIYFQLKTND